MPNAASGHRSVPGRTTMRVEELSGEDAAVYRAVAEVGAPHLQDIARVAGLDLDRTRAAVHRLLHTEPKILHEVPDTSRTDLGPTYELAPRACPRWLGLRPALAGLALVLGAPGGGGGAGVLGGPARRPAGAGVDGHRPH